jgi:hypothetical protein
MKYCGDLKIWVMGKWLRTSDGRKTFLQIRMAYLND